MLNEQLKLIRKKNRFTQQQVSDLLEIERSTYASYETGRNRPDISLLAAFAKIFGITVDYLINIDPSKELSVYDLNLSIKKEQGGTIVSELVKDEKEVLSMYRLCSDEDREKIKAVLKDLKKENLKNMK